MPKLQRWLIASKMVEVLGTDTVKGILGLGGQIGGGWCEIHQHICVNAQNKEVIEVLLQDAGFDISYPSEKKVMHPEIYHTETPAPDKDEA